MLEWQDGEGQSGEVWQDGGRQSGEVKQDDEGQSGEVRPTQYVKIRAWCDVPCDVRTKHLSSRSVRNETATDLYSKCHTYWLVLYLVDGRCSWWII